MHVSNSEQKTRDVAEIAGIDTPGMAAQALADVTIVTEDWLQFHRSLHTVIDSKVRKSPNAIFTIMPIPPASRLPVQQLG
jgi:hypothetical protein